MPLTRHTGPPEKSRPARTSTAAFLGSAAKWGEKYEAAVRETGYDVGTLMNAASVCRRVEISRRREKLSFAHHAEVAKLPAEEQERDRVMVATAGAEKPRESRAVSGGRGKKGGNRGAARHVAALDAFVTGHRQGKRSDLVDNVNEVGRPSGNARQQALRRLRKDRPELAARDR